MKFILGLVAGAAVVIGIAGARVGESDKFEELSAEAVDGLKQWLSDLRLQSAQADTPAHATIGKASPKTTEEGTGEAIQRAPQEAESGQTADALLFPGDSIPNDSSESTEQPRRQTGEGPVAVSEASALSGQTPVARYESETEGSEPGIDMTFTSPVTAEPTPEYVESPVWTAFYSEASARGFARRLSDALDRPFEVRRTSAQQYLVTFRYTDEAEWVTVQNQMHAVLGEPGD